LTTAPLVYDVVEGTQAGANITTAAGVTIQGFGSGQAITTGSNNTIFGYNSSNTLATGAGNTVVGANVSGPSAAAANVVILADGTGQARFDYGLTIAAVNTITGTLNVTGGLGVNTSTALAAGAATQFVAQFSTTAGFGIYYGSGAPSFAAAVNSLYIRSDGSSSSTRMYMCSVASGTWVAVTTAS